MKKWGFVGCCTLLLCLFAAQTAFAEQTETLGGRWLADGAGFVEKDFVRTSLTADGYIDIISVNANGTETISGFNVYATLHVTKAEIKAWSNRGSYQLPYPAIIPNYSPTLSNPLTLPSFKIDDIEYTIVLTSTTSGTVKIRGYADIDRMGKCEVNADCAIWKEGTPKPSIPDTGSGCSTLGTAPLALLIPLLLLKGKQSRRA